MPHPNGDRVILWFVASVLSLQSLVKALAGALDGQAMLPFIHALSGVVFLLAVFAFERRLPSAPR